MKAIIDCGTYLGKSIAVLTKKHKGFNVFAFEPVPQFYEHVKKEYPNINLYQKAAWISNEKRKLYLGKSEGSSLLPDKTTNFVSKEKFITVDCIDFSQWIADNFSKSDTIVLKLDIEGAEYAVLEKMIADETIQCIDILYCEWHYRKILSISEKKHRALLEKLDMKVENWR